MKAEYHGAWRIFCLIWLLGCTDPVDKPDLLPTQTGSSQASSLADELLDEIMEFNHPVIARAGLTPLRIRAGESTTLVTVIKIQPGWHIYAPGGTSRYAIPTQLELKLPDGILPASEWEYPAGRAQPDSEELVYENSVVITRLLKAAPELKLGSQSLVCVVYYAACEGIRCLPPEAQSLQVNFEAIK